jgi:hypothetical protein
MSKVVTAVLSTYLLLREVPFAGPASAFAGACDGSIVSVKAGTKSSYRTTGGDPMDYTVTITEVSETGFTERHEFANATFDVAWRCLPEGLQALQRATLGVSPDGRGAVKFDTLSASGVRFPPRTRWIPGATWTESHTVRVSIPNAPMTFPPMTVTHRYRIVARERVTVPAGSFDAFKLAITESADGGSELTQSGHFWVADGGSVVKAETRDPEDGKVHRIELVKFQR